MEAQVPTVIVVAMTLMVVFIVFAAWVAHGWRQRALRAEAFINNPNVKQRDKAAEYKESYERLVNTLEDERRQQHETLMEVFDYLNDNQPFGSHNEGLMQCRNKLMVTIQNSTYGRG